MEETAAKNRLIPVSQFAEGDWLNNNQKWIQLYPYDTWDHPFYGSTTIDRENASALKANFDSRVKDPRVFTDYEHGLDRAKGNKASGEIVEVDVRDDGLWGLVEFTAVAKDEIDAGEWNYWSTSHYDTWTNPHNNESIDWVLDGGGLTNKPWVKGMIPLNFSEIMIEDPKNFADWSTAYKNNLPDSAFMHIEPGGKKDSSGKTVPRSLRHFPYKDATGKVDTAHLQKIVQLAPKANLPGTVCASCAAKAKGMLGAKNMSELTVIDEMAPEEFQEPGTGIIDPTINPDDAYPSRIDTPPPGEDGSIPARPVTGGENSMEDAEVIAELRTKLGIEDDVDIVAHVSGMNDELEPLRELKKDHSERKQFAELFPSEYERMQKLEKSDRENFAKSFSEKLAARRFSRATGEVDDEGKAKNENTSYGLSAKAIDDISDIVKKFSENSATLEDFSGVLDSMLDSGIVDYGNRGSTLEPVEVSGPKNPQEGRKMFAEKVNEIVEKDELDFDSALVEAAKRYPALYDSYMTPIHG